MDVWFCILIADCLHSYRVTLRSLELDPDDNDRLLAKCHKRCAERLAGKFIFIFYENGMFKLILDVLGLIRSSRRMVQYSSSLGNILQPWVTYYRLSGQYWISALICA